MGLFDLWKNKNEAGTEVPEDNNVPVKGMNAEEIAKFQKFCNDLSANDVFQKVVEEEVSYIDAMETLMKETITVSNNLQAEFMKFNKPSGNLDGDEIQIEKPKFKSTVDAIPALMEQRKITAKQAVEVIKQEFPELIKNPFKQI